MPSLYLGVLVFFQILTLLIMSRFFFQDPATALFPVGVGLSRALERIAERIVHTAMTRMAGEGRTARKAAAGIMRGMYGVYGQALPPGCRPGAALQVMFNVGAVGATLIRVLPPIRPLGWQSTVQMSSQAVHLLSSRSCPLPGPGSWEGMQPQPGTDRGQPHGPEGRSRLLATGTQFWWPSCKPPPPATACCQGCFYALGRLR